MVSHCEMKIDCSVMKYRNVVVRNVLRLMFHALLSTKC